MFSRLGNFLNDRFFPLIVRYATSRLHISLMVCLWIALLVCGSFTAFELVGGNYTNGLSGLLGCIILLQQNQHRAETQSLHEKVDFLQKMHDEQKRLHAVTVDEIKALAAKVKPARATKTTPAE